jgi:ubiquinone/menaquinone biosynthesis C-methylase UbiE
MTQREANVVQWVYASKNEQELAERYDEWAKTYDEDLDKDFGWVGPLFAVETAVKYVPKDARILDAGAGTGLVGQLLSERGYANLVAMDLSEGMLNEARKKNAYQEFHQMVMGQTLGFPSNSFDAVISVGVLTVGHAPAGSLDEFVRVTRPAGHVVFTLRPDVYEGSGFKEKHAELESQGQWKLIEASNPEQVLPKGEPEVLHQVWVYRISP